MCHVLPVTGKDTPDSGSNSMKKVRGLYGRGVPVMGQNPRIEVSEEIRRFKVTGVVKRKQRNRPSHRQWTVMTETW